MDGPGEYSIRPLNKEERQNDHASNLADLLLGAINFTARADEYIKIGDFNIAEFSEGDHPQTRDVKFIAKMLVNANLDLIAFEEVEVTEQAQTQLNILVKRMNKVKKRNQPSYFSYITPQTGDERYTVIYRSPVVMGDDFLWLDEDKDPGNPRAGGTIYYRIPVAIPFTADDFDFYVVVMHLAWGDLDRRRTEVAALRDFLMAKDDAEDDWIVVGDMNRYGKFKISNEKQGLR